MNTYKLLVKSLKLLGILILLQQISCALPKKYNYRTHPDFYEYIENFEDALDIDVFTPISYTTYLPNTFVGACFTTNDGDRFILIKKSYWLTINTKQKLELIFHELGHCELGYMDHDNSKLKEDRKCPNSFMNSMVFNYIEANSCITKYFDHYINDLTKKGGL